MGGPHRGLPAGHEERALRVVEAWHGRARRAGEPSEGYTTGRHCQACGGSYERCVGQVDEWFEWSKGRQLVDLADESAPRKSCCPSCQFETQSKLHDVIVVEPHEQPTDVF